MRVNMSDYLPKPKKKLDLVDFAMVRDEKAINRDIATTKALLSKLATEDSKRVYTGYNVPQTNIAEIQRQKEYLQGLEKDLAGLKKIRYENVISKPDFPVYSLANPKNKDEDYQFINATGAYGKEGVKEMAALHDTKWTAYYRMTPEEKGKYNYLYAKSGKKEAREYLDTITDDLSRRAGKEMAKGIGNNAFAKVALSPAMGIEQWGTGMRQNLSPNKAMQTTPFAYAGQEMRSTLEGLPAIAYDSGQMIGNMVPSIGANLLVPGSGLAAMGFSAKGNAQKEALEAGYDPMKAQVYGIASGLTEVVTEKVLGGISALTGGNALMRNLDDKIGAISNGIVRGLAKYGISAMSESVEEGVQTAIEPVIKTAILGDKFEPAKLEEVAYSALLGAIGAGVFEGSSIIAEERGTKAIGKEVRKSGLKNIEEVINMGLQADPQTPAFMLANKAKARLDRGLPVSKYALGKIAEQITADHVLGQGTIEERVTDLGHTLGRKVEFFDGATDAKLSINGFFKDGTIYINRNSENHAASIFGHELTHSIENSEYYPELSRLVLGQYRESGVIDTMMKEKRDLYAKNKIILTDQEVSAELVAEYAEKHLFTDERAIKKLIKEKPTLGQRIMSWIDGVLARFGNKKSQERIMLEKAREIYRKALGESTGKRGQGQYSIKDTLYGGKYVDVDRGILNGVLPEDFSRATMDYLKKNYPSGLKIGGQEITINSKSRNRVQYSNYAGKILRKDVQTYKDRLSSYGNIDELLSVSRDYVDQEIYKTRKDGFTNFAKSNILLKVDGNEYSADVVIGTKESGEAVLYDITDMRPLSILKDNKKDTGRAVHTDSSGTTYTSDTSNQTISQEAEDVNTKFSLREKNQENFVDQSKGITEFWDNEAWKLLREGQDWEWQGQSIPNLSPESMKVLEKQERQLRQTVKNDLGISKFLDVEAVDRVVRAISERYLKYGAIPDRIIDRAFAEIRKNAVIKNKEFYETYKSVKKGLRETKVMISKQDRADIPDFEAFRKKNFGTLRIVNEGGTPVDVTYKMLVELFPDLFPSDVTHPADQLQMMSDVAKSIQVSENMIDDHYSGEELSEYARVNFRAAVKNMTAKLNLIERYEADISLNKEREKNLADPTRLEKNIEDLNEEKRSLLQSRSKIIKNHLLTQGDLEVAKLYAEGKLTRDQVMKQTKDGQAVIAVAVRDQKVKKLMETLKDLEDQRKAIEDEESKRKHSRRMELMEKGIRSKEDMETFYEYRQEAKKSYDRLMNWKGFTEDDLQIINRWNLGEISDQYSGIDNSPQREQIIKAHELFNEVQKWDRAFRKYKKGLNEKRNAEADKFLTTVDEWKDKATGFQYDRETAERNIYDVVPDRELARKIIDRYIDPISKSNAMANNLKNRYAKRIRALNISRNVEAGNEVSESHAVQFLGEAYYHIQKLSDQRAKGMEKIDRVNYPADRRTEKIQELMNRQSGHGTLEHWQEAVSKFLDKNTKLNLRKVFDAVDEFKKIYDELFPMINEAYMRNGYDPLEYRAGYFPHYQESDREYNLWAQYKADSSTLFGILKPDKELSTDINGMTEYFKPGRKFFANALQRKGNNTVYDALEGFDKYIETAADVIYQTDNIQSLRALARRIRALGADESVRQGIEEEIEKIMDDESIPVDLKNKRVEELFESRRTRLAKFVTWLEEYTNILAGKTAKLDRWGESFGNRSIFKAYSRFASRVGMNMVAGNISSALTNFVPLSDLWAEVGTDGFLKAARDVIKSERYHDRLHERSVFLTNRRGYIPVSETKLEKAGRVLSGLMEGIDQFSSEVVVRSRYNQMVDRGLSAEAALEEADSFAKSLMAGRGKGEMPVLFSSKTLKPFTMFQLEVNNHLSYLWKDMPREYADRKKKELWAAFFKVFIGHWLINELYETIYGRRVALDPISILNDTMGDMFGYKMPNTINAAEALLTGKKNLGQVFQAPSKKAPVTAKRFGVNVLQEVPFVGGWLGGGRLPINAAFPDLDNLNNAIFSDWDIKKKLQVGAKEIAKPLAYTVMPFAGGQVKKTLEGAGVALSGGQYRYDKEGKPSLDFPFYRDNPLEATTGTLKALTFGRMASQEAIDWVDNDFKGLGVGKTGAMEEMMKSGMTRREAFETVKSLNGKGSTENKIKLLNMDMPDKKKEIAYKAMFSTDKEVGKIDQYKKVGLGINDYLKAVSAKDEIDDLWEKRKEDGQEAKQSDKALDFSRWINRQDYTAEQRSVIADTVKFYSVMPVKTDRYDKFVAGGVSEDVSYKLTNILSDLKPLEGKNMVSRMQKIEAVIHSGLPEAEIEKAILTLANDSDVRKMQAGKNFGLSVKDFVTYRGQLEKIGSGTSISQKEAEQAIRKLRISNKAKAALWQLQDERWKAENNPFDRMVGIKIKSKTKPKEKNKKK